MEIHFNIVEKKTSWFLITYYVMLGVAIPALFISTFLDEGKEPPHMRTGVILCFLIGISVINVVRSFLVRDFVKIGQIRFCQEGIILKIGEKITVLSLSELHSLSFVINETNDDSVSPKSFVNKKGIDNYIEIVDCNGERIRYRIFIEGITVLRVLDRFLSSWQYKNYQLKGTRSITGY